MKNNSSFTTVARQSLATLKEIRAELYKKFDAESRDSLRNMTKLRNLHEQVKELDEKINQIEKELRL